MVAERNIPEWLKVKMPSGDNFKYLDSIISNENLNTVCKEARCPNIGECWNQKTATFMILGDTCTRACTYCAVTSGNPNQLDLAEPIRLSNTVNRLGLEYAVITSVNRDDLPDGGAEIFSQCIKLIKKNSPYCKVEVLTPDFQGNLDSLKSIINEKPDTFNHNIETVRRIFPKIRAKGNYELSINVLGQAKQLDKNLITKSGMMVGVGETLDEIIDTLKDLRSVNCDLLTVGQYLRPSKKHTAMARWYTPSEFKKIQSIGYELGFKHVASGPLVRSSYHAKEQHNSAKSTLVG
ncbi:MAG: lipoyl synthase [SAR202 cluster bacterium]|nr:lipoyl synthase [SAR202 cluster bacterium]